jgi:uncharacterized protein (DUF362 family)
MKSKVSLVKGDSRREIIYRSLKLLENEIKEKIKGKRVLIKPNFVSTKVLKAVTHPDQIRGILDFLSEFYKEKIIIAEGACGDTFSAFQNFGYFKLKEEYPQIEFFDLNKDEFKEVLISKGERVRVSKTILDPDLFIISSTRIKTHDTVIATLSLKNLVVGMILEESDKAKIHQGIKEINYNLLLLAKERVPDLASLDGFESMEGEGPVVGDMVKTKVAIASLDFLSADRIALEIMGIDPNDIGYLLYCHKEGLGNYDINEIEIVGDRLKECVFKRKFKMHSRFSEMLLWKEKNPPSGLGKPILYDKNHK